MSQDPARRVAADVLIAVDKQEAFANLLLPRFLSERKISGRDAAFATEITYGASRRAGVIAPVIAAAAKRDLATLDVEVRAVVLLGAYQILHTRVPARAAVSTSVDLIREFTGPRAAGLVNAVLRRVAERTWPQWVEQLAPDAGTDPIGHLAFDAGYPTWIATAFADTLGLAGASGLDELRAVLVDQSPSVHLVARPRRVSRDELVVEAGGVAGALSPFSVLMAGGDPGALPSVRSGAAAVQDEGSQCVAIALAEAPVLDDRGIWLDLCAGPGGKSALLEGLLSAGGVLLSADVSQHRARLVRQTRLSSDVVVADGKAPAWRSGSFDRVLVDAPCTGLGALRRRPEARWRKQPADLSGLVALQAALLATAIEACRPGGVVCYSTCSPHPAETVQVVDAALRQHPEMSRHLPDTQLWPHRDGTDAMYFSLLRKADL